MRVGLDISVLSEQQRTGISVYVYNLVENLIKQNPNDEFVLFGLTPLATYDYINRLPLKNYPNVTFKIYRLPARIFRQVFIWWQRLNWPSIELLIGEVDLFHSFNWWLPPQRKGKVVATVFDVTSITHPEWHHPRTTQLDKIRFQRMMNRADLIITISNNSEKDLKRLMQNCPTTVIYPAANGQFNRKLSQQNIVAVLSKYQLEPGYILAVGTIEPRKNLERLIKAYLESGLKEKLVLVGMSGWKNNRIYSLVQKNSAKIILPGFIPDEDLPAFYQGSSVFAYISLYEGFGIPPVEAMSSGVPVIMANNSSLPEVGGQSVYYVDAKSIDQISLALKRVSHDQKLRYMLALSGKKQAQEFSWSNSAKKLIKMYRSLFERSEEIRN